MLKNRSDERTGKLKKRSKSDTNGEARGLGAGSRTVLPNVLKLVVNSSAHLLQEPGGEQGAQGLDSHSGWVFALRVFPPPLIPAHFFSQTGRRGSKVGIEILVESSWRDKLNVSHSWAAQGWPAPAGQKGIGHIYCQQAHGQVLVLPSASGSRILQHGDPHRSNPSWWPDPLPGCSVHSGMGN